MIPGSANPLLLATADAGGYTISRSLRFNSADSAYLSRTPASAGNRKTWTWAGWVKRSELGRVQNIFRVVGTLSDTTVFQIRFMSNDAIGVVNYSYFPLISTPLYRDTSAWYHIVVVLDTTQATASNRLRFYINGTEVTTWATDNRASLTQNSDQGVNQASVAHQIGGQGTSEYFSGYLADIHFIDGQALDPTSFGEFSATTGVWMPKAFTGSYGTNGFKLDFADNSAATAAVLGKDTSGNGNNWTPTNLSVTAGAGNDSLIDVPVNGSQTDTGVGGEVRGNYCTINPIAGSGSTLSNGNLDIVATNASLTHHKSTIAVSSGKWYFEATLISGASSTDPLAGIATVETAAGTYPGQAATSYAVYAYNANTYLQKVNNAAFTNLSATTFATNDVLGVALDLDNGKVWFSKNGTWADSGNPATGANAAFTGLSGTFTPVFRGSGAGGSSGWYANFGQRPFTYTAPSGFKALCTANLPAPTIVKPSTVMDVVTYAGNGSSTRSITGLSFSPDLVWLKNRNNTYSHTLYDIVRGAGANKALFSNGTFAEGGNPGSDDATYGYVSSLDSAGFSLVKGSDATSYTNGAASTYAAWTWDAGSSTVSNTAGTITSSVRANASAGCSVVGYTGNNTNGATVGHGLGVAPSLIIVKRRAVADDWIVYHSTLGATKHLLLNSTAAEATGSNRWNSTAPTSNVFSLGSHNSVNASSATYIAYCFAPVAGYSAFGSYTGNGSTDGPFVYTGFRPRWIMIKQTNGSGGDWWVFDGIRNPFNLTDLTLRANLSDAEAQASATVLDINSNGFKMRGTSSSFINLSTATYVWAAFAESPFQYSRAR